MLLEPPQPATELFFLFRIYRYRWTALPTVWAVDRQFFCPFTILHWVFRIQWLALGNRDSEIVFLENSTWVNEILSNSYIWEFGKSKFSGRTWCLVAEMLLSEFPVLKLYRINIWLHWLDILSQVWSSVWTMVKIHLGDIIAIRKLNVH